MNEAEQVFSHFKTLSTIPRGSGNCRGVRAFLCAFAHQNGLRYRADEANNVVIFKPAAPAYQNRPTVILQGHTDMVCAAQEGCEIDFLHQAISVEEQGDFLFAKGTSLGGDDGIAVAMMLALLESDIALPALECVFTADEEIGMIGANALDMSDLQGKYLINIDSEDEGVLTVACAGGSTLKAVLPVQREGMSALLYDIRITGLKGGHSGTEIAGGGLNANQLLAEVLAPLDADKCRVVTIGGGEKENAIATAAHVIVAAKQQPDFSYLSTLQRTWQAVEPQLCVICRQSGGGSTRVMSRNSTQALKQLLKALPQGVIKMSEFDHTAVQTSLNMGVLETQMQAVTMTYCVRSCMETEREMLEKTVQTILQRKGGYVRVSGIYPAWEYKEHSVLREKAMRVFEELFGYTPKTESIHAGLECGVFSGKRPDLEYISLGPQMYDVHTPREKLSIASVCRTWQYLIALLRAL